MTIAVATLIGTIIDRIVPRGDWNLFAVVLATALPVALILFGGHQLRSNLLIDVRTEVDNKVLYGFIRKV